MKPGSRQAWGKDWIVLLLLMKFLKACPLIIQQKIISQLVASVKSHLLSLRLCFAHYPCTLPRFPTFDAGKELLSRAGPWWPSCYSSVMGGDLCVFWARKVHHEELARHAWRHELIFPSKCDTKETQTLSQWDVCVCTQTQPILVYAGAIPACASLHVVTMGRMGVCAETAKLLHSDSFFACAKITSLLLVVSPLPLHPLTQKNLKGTSSRY